MDLIACRELPSKRHDMTSFHIVIPDSKNHVAKNFDSWPKYVILRRYFLNAESREWIKSLNNVSESGNINSAWKMKCALLNARCVCNISDFLNNYFLNSEIDLTAFTETWIPQPSVFGSLLFLFYLLPVFDYLHDAKVLNRFYSDDAQLFFPFSEGESLPSGSINSVVSGLKNFF